jgi:hypothetical protein
MALISGLAIIGIRGGVQLRPINIVTAANYTTAKNVPLVLNTPFSVIRTWNSPQLITRNWFRAEKELDQVYTPVHQGKPGNFRRMNVMNISAC